MSPTEQNARRLPQNAKGREAPYGFAYPGGKAGEATGSGPPTRGLNKATRSPVQGLGARGQEVGAAAVSFLVSSLK